jgi:hypothetical protein
MAKQSKKEKAIMQRLKEINTPPLQMHEEGFSREPLIEGEEESDNAMACRIAGELGGDE